MNRSVIVYGALLCAALLGAYWSWNHEPTTSASRSVEVASFAPESVEAIRYEAGRTEIQISMKRDKRGRYAWVEHTKEKPDAAEQRRQRPPEEPSGSDAGEASTAPDATADTGQRAPDAGSADAMDATKAAASGSAEPQSGSAGDSNRGDTKDTETTTQSFKASAALDRLLKDLDPLKAVRRLDPEPREAEKLYGFDDPFGTLAIESSGGTRAFTIGGYAYGRQNIYVRDESDGSYFVVEASLISPLKFAETRLREQRVLGESERDIERVEVQSDGETITLAQHNVDDPRAAFWSIGAESDEESRTASSWVSKLTRIEISEYLSDKEPEDAELAAVVEVVPREGPTTEIRFLKRKESKGRTRYFAKSDFSRRFVELRVSTASSLLADLDTLFDPEARRKRGGESADKDRRAPPGTKGGGAERQRPGGMQNPHAPPARKGARPSRGRPAPAEAPTKAPTPKE